MTVPASVFDRNSEVTDWRKLTDFNNQFALAYQRFKITKHSPINEDTCRKFSTYLDFVYFPNELLIQVIARSSVERMKSSSARSILPSVKFEDRGFQPNDLHPNAIVSEFSVGRKIYPNVKKIELNAIHQKLKGSSEDPSDIETLNQITELVNSTLIKIYQSFPNCEKPLFRLPNSVEEKTAPA